MVHHRSSRDTLDLCQLPVLLFTRFHNIFSACTKKKKAGEKIKVEEKIQIATFFEMSFSKTTKSACSLATLLFHVLVLSSVFSGSVLAQYEFDGAEAGAPQQQQQQGSRMAHLVAANANSRTPWDSVNQAILEKCIQMQTMTLKKRNFGLEIPDIIMNRVQGGTEGSTNLKELRMRMVANGK